jgi:hypothetical protein
MRCGYNTRGGSIIPASAVTLFYRHTSEQCTGDHTTKISFRGVHITCIPALVHQALDRLKQGFYTPPLSADICQAEIRYREASSRAAIIGCLYEHDKTCLRVSVPHNTKTLHLYNSILLHLRVCPPTLVGRVVHPPRLIANWHCFLVLCR